MSQGVKRKEPTSDEDDSPSYGLRQILPVANLPGDFDGEPQDGLQYLFTVRRENRKLPEFTRVPNPYEIPDGVPKEAPASLPVPKAAPFLPAREWRETLSRRFKNFQKNIMQPTTVVQRPDSGGRGQKLFPEKKDREAWWSFLEGAPPSVWDTPRAPKKQKGGRRNQRDISAEGWVPVHQEIPAQERETEQEAEQEYEVEVEQGYSTNAWGRRDNPADYVVYAPEAPQPASSASSVVKDTASSMPTSSAVPSPQVAREPTPKLIRSIDHRLALHLLMYFTYWMILHLEISEARRPSPVTSKYMPTQAHARWMFSLLSRVDEFCSADEMSTLRALARSCIRLLKLRQGRERSGSPSRNDAAVVVEDTETRGPTNEMDDTSCWIIISIIANTWGQHDLWTDAEEMLA
ncbi:hypothetical protein EVG20_g9461 [Dentipellis fragilis]|uniref:Uncharacterized protein n=1 Tax=Dentipellis fragilis TaxID=205917 RepID=A0A4Y9XZZ9_9AGAM|nr:hypothetical protein EVG20_g9461 [Dentipellis fragilis]